MSDGMRRELVYLSSHATNRYFIPNWGNLTINVLCSIKAIIPTASGQLPQTRL